LLFVGYSECDPQLQGETQVKSPIKSAPAVTAAAPVNQTAKATDETAKAIQRLSGERDAYNKAQKVAALEEKERASLKLQESFKAGWQWAHGASYGALKEVAEGGGSWVEAQRMQRVLRTQHLYGDHDVKEWHAGAKAFFELLPKD
jgi:hypothetical protein